MYKPQTPPHVPTALPDEACLPVPSAHSAADTLALAGPRVFQARFPLGPQCSLLTLPGTLPLNRHGFLLHGSQRSARESPQSAQPRPLCPKGAVSRPEGVFILFRVSSSVTLLLCVVAVPPWNPPQGQCYRPGVCECPQRSW